MALRTFLSVVVLLAFVTIVDGQGRRHELDLRVDISQFVEGIDLIPPADRLEHSITVMADGPPPPVSPFGITLVSLETPAFTMLWRDIPGSFWYEVRIENISRQPLNFPTSLDERRFRRSMKGAATVQIGLRVEDPVVRYRFMGSITTFGAEELPDSVVRLQPGDSILVQADSSGLGRSSKEVAGVRRVRAAITMVQWTPERNAGYLGEAISTNSIAVDFPEVPDRAQ